jgi:hypothetical protein
MKQGFKPPDKPKLIPEKKTGTHVADTAAHSPFIIEKPDSLLKASPVIIAPPAIIVPPPGIMKPPIEIKPRKKYGVEVSDSDYRFNVKPKEG